MVGLRAVDGAEHGNRGVVDQDVEAAQCRRRLADDRRGGGRVGLVCPDGGGPGARGAQLPGDLLRGLRGVQVSDGHVGARSG